MHSVSRVTVIIHYIIVQTGTSYKLMVHENGGQKQLL